MKEIDLSDIIRKRIGGWKGNLIPGFLLSGLERIVCQEQLNELLRLSGDRKGSEFSRGILELLNIKVEVEGLENLPADKPFVFASNHPLGGLDGITLVAILGEYFGDGNIRVLVNDMLMHVEPLSHIFLPINKYGSQAKRSATIINEAFASGKSMVFFPAGLVSRLQPSGKIRDLSWKKAVVAKALEFDREIIPVSFIGQNSMLFYRTAKFRKKLGLKINIEQILLPSEIFKSKKKTFRLVFGKPVNPAEFSDIPHALKAIQETVNSQLP